MSNNDVLLEKVFDAIKALNDIKNLVEKTEVKTTSILEVLNKQEDTIKEHIEDIATIKAEIRHIQEDIRLMKIDIKTNELNNNNLYRSLSKIEKKESKRKRIKNKIINIFKIIIANKYAIAIYTSLILAFTFLVVKIFISFTGNYFGIEDSIINFIHKELDNR